MKCIILEDEQAAVDVLTSYIEKVPSLSCLGVYESGLDVPIEQLKQADFLFLDIQLPELDGISFVKSLPAPPKIIVTSAYEEYAISAFDIAVSDYLLKPYAFERFYKAISRVNEQINGPIQKEPYLYVYVDKTTYKIKPKEILFVKAEVDYVKIVMPNTELLVLDSLKNWLIKLEPYGFVQNHRSYIVQMETIVSITKGRLKIQKHDLPIGPSYWKGLFDKFHDKKV